MTRFTKAELQHMDRLGTMTPRQRRATIRFIVHMAVLIVFGTLLVLIGLLTLSNQAAIMIMQTDTLDKLNEISLAVEVEDPVPEPEPADPTASLTPDERDLVYRIVMAEARGEDLQGQMAVAQVILDRSTLWDMSVTDVVTAPGQFADPYTGEISDSARLAVANVFDGGVRVFDDPVTHFAEGEPYWAAEKECRGSIGRHQFWY